VSYPVKLATGDLIIVDTVALKPFVAAMKGFASWAVTSLGSAEHVFLASIVADVRLETH
jgi:hypothetical protein